MDLDELINNVILFGDGRDEELRNILKRLTYQEQNRRYQRAKSVISDIKNISSFLNCYDEYELNISDNVKNNIQKMFSFKSSNLLQIISILFSTIY